MKKIALLLAFCGLAFIGVAQVTVVNATPVPVFVGVQYATVTGCTPVDADGGVWMLPGDELLFTPPIGMVVLRVGLVSGAYGTGYEYPACRLCAPNAPGAYTFYWESDCSVVKITD